MKISPVIDAAKEELEASTRTCMRIQSLDLKKRAPVKLLLKSWPNTVLTKFTPDWARRVSLA